MNTAHPAAIVLGAIVLAIIVIAVIVIGARHKARRKIVSAVKNESRHDEARPTIRYGPSIRTQAAASVQPAREMPSIKVETKPDKGAEVARPIIRNAESAAEAPFTVLAQQGIRESLKAPPPSAEKEMFPEVAADSEVQPAQAETETHAEERAQDAERGPATEDVNRSKAEQAGGSVRQESRGERDITTPQEPRRVSPEKRGGRSRGGDQESKSEQTTKGLRRNPKPEIVCWKRDREWDAGPLVTESVRRLWHQFLMSRLREQVLPSTRLRRFGR
jgi:hypothetical protein